MTESTVKKLTSLSFMGASAIVGLFCAELALTLWAMFRLPTSESWLLAPADVAGVLCGVVAYAALMFSAPAKKFVGEVIIELSKVVWPPRKETMLSTGVISVVVMICAMLLFGFDSMWGTLVNLFYR